MKKWKRMQYGNKKKGKKDQKSNDGPEDGRKEKFYINYYLILLRKERRKLGMHAGERKEENRKIKSEKKKRCSFHVFLIKSLPFWSILER